MKSDTLQEDVHRDEDNDNDNDTFIDEEKAKKPGDRAFDDPERIRDFVSRKRHRSLVGMAWDPMGNLQLELLKSAGMMPAHRVFDIGCGCLRAGVKIIPYLEENHYFGVDSRQPLVGVGFKRELKRAELEGRLARDNLFVSGVFEHARLPEGSVDYGLCIGMMTHMSLNHVRMMLENAGKYFTQAGILFVSFFELPDGEPFGKPHANPMNVKTRGHKAPFHYYKRDMEYAATGTGWKPTYIGEWGEPDGQMLMRYDRAVGG